MSDRPSTLDVADRARVIYAIARRGAIELVVNETQGEPTRLAQAERARVETDRWLEQESLMHEVRGSERALLDAPSGSWPAEAVRDSMWRKEALGVLLWSLQHLDVLPEVGSEFAQAELDGVITRYGSVSSFRANGLLRPSDELEQAWLEADAWFGATEGRGGDDAALASIAAEQFRALSWLRDASAAPA